MKNEMINEVQITCCILAALTSIILGLLVPLYSTENKIVKTARKILTLSSILIGIHFLIQYFLHKNGTVLPETRTIINLLFGIPIGFFINMSLLYLQRRGNIRKWEYWLAPIIYIVVIAVISAALLPAQPWISVFTATTVMSLLYAVSLFVYYGLQLAEYVRIRRDISMGDSSQKLLVKWSQTPMFAIMIVGCTLPFMTFCTNLLFRSICGLIAISISFFFIFCFISYDLLALKPSEAVQTKAQDKAAAKKEETSEPAEHLDEEKLQSIQAAADKLIESGFHLKSGITVKDVATEMGISRATLNMWLQTTEYKKFNNWLMVVRIEEAKKLLREHPNWSNETIAASCGFCDRSYFQRQFNEVVGTTPSKWSKGIRKGEKKDTE